MMMKSFLTKAVLAVAVCGMVAGCSTASKTPLAKNDRIVFLGDSITAAGVWPGGYVKLTADKLAELHPKLNVQIIGAGISAHKVTDCQYRLKRDVLDKKPTIVVIYIGINDVWHQKNNAGTLPKPFEAGLRDMVKKINDVGARVILCTPTVIGEKTGGVNHFDKLLDQYAGIGRKVAKDTGSQMIDLRKAFVDYLDDYNTTNKAAGVLTTDTVHLNALGNKFVSGLVLEALGVDRKIAFAPVWHRAPEFDMSTARAFADRTQCKIIQTVKEGKVRYTLDGTEPTKASAKYRGAIDIDKTTTVKARFFHKCGYASPVITRVFRKIEPISWKGTTLSPGLSYKYYEGTWPKLPDFGKIKPAASGVAPGFSLAVRKRDDNFGMAFTGYVRIPKDGTYTFFSTSDDGSRLFIDGKQVVDNDGLHGMIEKSGAVKLTAGIHTIRLIFAQGVGGRGLRVSYQGPGIDKQEIAEFDLYHDAAGE